MTSVAEAIDGMSTKKKELAMDYIWASLEASAYER